jgi:hypothetical protein
VSGSDAIVVYIIPIIGRRIRRSGLKLEHGAATIAGASRPAQVCDPVTTAFGGDLNCSGGFGCGVVFELTEAGGTWTYTNLYSFQDGNDGAVPSGNIVIDSKGNIYSTTTAGGGSKAGIAFKLSPPQQKGGAWTETTLHTFKAPAGAGDNGGLTWGKWGDLYGVTYLGGTGCPGSGCGTVFELQP